MNKAIFICLFILVTISLCGETVRVKRENTPLREGPGAWYEVLTTIPKDYDLEKLEQEEDDYGQWLKVKFNDIAGFVSLVSTKDLPPKKDIFAVMAKQYTSTTANRHSVSAGVKGFGQRFSKTFKGSSSFVEDAMTYNINPKDYKKFKKATYKGFSLRRNRKKVKLPKKEKEEYFTEAETGLGLGIASVIAEQGLYLDKELQNYINFVGLQLVEAFDLTEINFKFYILKLNNPNAYATPGGLIFITKGMLDLCDNEAELAVVLAHEVVHVAYNHGMKEIVERKNHISAENLFIELDSEISFDDNSQTVEKELEEDAFKIYETLIEGRLDQYEKEADRVGMIVAARAGYDPHGLLKMLDKIGRNTVKSNNQHYRPDIITQRKGWVAEYLQKATFPKNLFHHEDRFKMNTN